MERSQLEAYDQPEIESRKKKILMELEAANRRLREDTESLDQTINTMIHNLDIDQKTLEQRSRLVKVDEPFIQIQITKLEDIQHKDGLTVKFSIDNEAVKNQIEELQNSQSGSKIDEIRQIQKDYIDRRLTECKITVSTIGNYKRGKSYLNSKISGQNFNLSQLERTQGLHYVVGGQHRNWMFIDTAGHGEPLRCYQTIQNLRRSYQVQREQTQFSNERSLIAPLMPKESQELKDLEEEIEENFKNIEKTKTELYDSEMILEAFIQSYVLHESDALVVVVGQMTLEEEGLIGFVSNLFKKYISGKRLIIVHNFYNMTEVWQVRRQIQKDIINSFPVTWVMENRIENDEYLSYCYTDQTINPTNPVYHVVLAQEGSNAGQQFNAKSYDLINRIISQISAETRRMNVIERFCDFLSRELKDFFDARVEDEQNTSTDTAQPVAQQSNHNQKNVVSEIQDQWKSAYQKDPKSNPHLKNILESFSKDDAANQQQQNRNDQSQFCFAVLFEPYYQSLAGKIISPLMSHNKIRLLRKRPQLTISGQFRPSPPYGYVQPDYKVIDNKQKKHLHLFFEVAGAKNLVVLVKRLQGRRYLHITGKKELPQYFEITAQDNKQQLVETKINENSKKYLQLGDIDYKIDLISDSEREFNKAKIIVKRELYDNGTLHVVLDYGPENHIDE